MLGHCISSALQMPGLKSPLSLIKCPGLKEPNGSKSDNLPSREGLPPLRAEQKNCSDWAGKITEGFTMLLMAVGKEAAGSNRGKWKLIYFENHENHKALSKFG